jgi:deoxycitidine kinase
MSPLEWEIYKNWFSWLTESRMEKPSGFIYLQTDPEMCYERLLKRNRSEEAGVSIDYLKKLHERHEKWLIQKEELYPTLKNVPVLVLDCNHEFESSKARQQELINDIATFLSTQYNIQRDISLSQTSPL